MALPGDTAELLELPQRCGDDSWVVHMRHHEMGATVETVGWYHGRGEVWFDVTGRRVSEAVSFALAGLVGRNSGKLVPARCDGEFADTAMPRPQVRDVFAPLVIAAVCAASICTLAPDALLYGVLLMATSVSFAGFVLALVLRLAPAAEAGA